MRSIPTWRLRACLAAALLAAAVGSPAVRAEEAPPGPVPAPAPAPSAAPGAPAPAPHPAPSPAGQEGIPITFTEDRVQSPDGWVVWYYSVNFVDPKVLRAELDLWKSKEAKIEPMAGATGQPTNLLRIQERAENLPLLEKMLEVLDQPQPQVLVRAKLVEVTYSGKLEWGVETTYTAPSETFFQGAAAVFNPEAYLNASAARPFQGTTVTSGLQGDSALRYGNLDMIIRTLKSRGKAEIMGEPNVLATQGQKATIKAGEDVPIQQTNLTGTTLVASTRFEPTGIELEITPELIGKDAVRMKLKEKFSAVTGFVVGQGGVQNPIINKREAETVLTIRDGATLVVGGLQSKREIENESGIPLLMDIPVLGWFFSSQSVEEVKTELFFIVTPEIIRGSYNEGLIRPPSEKGRLDRLEK